jgi:hypothetical protein
VVHQGRHQNAHKFGQYLLIHPGADGLLKIVDRQIVGLKQLNENPESHFFLLEYRVDTPNYVRKSLRVVYCWVAARVGDTDPLDSVEIGFRIKKLFVFKSLLEVQLNLEEGWVRELELF